MQEYPQLKSNPRNNQIFALGSFVTGLIILWLVRDQDMSKANELAALALGFVLSLLGASGILFHENIVLTFNLKSKSFLCKRRTWVMARTRKVPFMHVAAVKVARKGASKPTYHLIIHLKNKQKIPTGFWVENEDVANNRAQEVAAYIGVPAELQSAPLRGGGGSRQVILAALTALAAYGLWYRWRIGPWSTAMWSGTIPPVFVLMVFVMILQLQKEISRHRK